MRKTICASPSYVNLKIPRNWSTVNSPISLISSSGGWVPISNSTTSILSAMTGGLLPLLRAASSICMASAWNWSENRGHLNVNDICYMSRIESASSIERLLLKRKGRRSGHGGKSRKVDMPRTRLSRRACEHSRPALAQHQAAVATISNILWLINASHSVELHSDKEISLYREKCADSRKQIHMCADAGVADQM